MGTRSIDVPSGGIALILSPLEVGEDTEYAVQFIKPEGDLTPETKTLWLLAQGMLDLFNSDPEMLIDRGIAVAQRFINAKQTNGQL